MRLDDFLDHVTAMNESKGAGFTEEFKVVFFLLCNLIDCVVGVGKSKGGDGTDYRRRCVKFIKKPLQKYSDL